MAWPSRSPQGELPIEAMRDIHDETPAEQVLARLGLPALAGRHPTRLKRPTAADYPAPDARLDRWLSVNETWVYHHRRRGKLPLADPMQTILTLREGLIVGTEHKLWQPDEA